MATIGSYEWAEASDGILSTLDKARVLFMLVQAKAIETVGRVGQRLRLTEPGLSPQHLDSIRVPDTPAAKAAEQLAMRSCSGPLLAHCLRTYYFGRLFARAHHVCADNELLYVGSLLHDLGLTGHHIHDSERAGFQVVGARAAFDFAQRQGWSIRRSRDLYESISYHLNPFVPMGIAPLEAALLQRGAMLDVIGMNRHQLGDAVIDRLNHRLPRTGFRDEILATMRDIRHARGCHAHVLGRCGFESFASSNPLDSSPAGAETM